MTPDELLRRYPRETVRWLRGRLGLSQLAFAGHLGVAPQTVTKWETGRGDISPFYRWRLVPLLAPQLATEAGRAWLSTLGEET